MCHIANEVTPEAGPACALLAPGALLRGRPTLLRAGSGARPPFGSCLPAGRLSLWATPEAHLWPRPGFRAPWPGGRWWLSHADDRAMRRRAISRASAAAANWPALVAARTCATRVQKIENPYGGCQMRLIFRGMHANCSNNVTIASLLGLLTSLICLAGCLQGRQLGEVSGLFCRSEDREKLHREGIEWLLCPHAMESSIGSFCKGLLNIKL